MSMISNVGSTGKSARPSDTRSVSGDKKAFLKKLESIKKPTTSNVDVPISKERLARLASDYKSGHIDLDEACNQFVGGVVNDSLPNKLSEKDREKIIDEISQFLSNDPEFLKKLDKNLSEKMA